VSYRIELASHAVRQFHALQRHQFVYDALMSRLVRLAEEPWDAWSDGEIGDPSAVRETVFGKSGNGLILFLVDDAAETIQIFNLLWID
jgi:hypothetical protein